MEKNTKIFLVSVAAGASVMANYYQAKNARERDRIQRLQIDTLQRVCKKAIDRMSPEEVFALSMEVGNDIRFYDIVKVLRFKW